MFRIGPPARAGSQKKALEIFSLYSYLNFSFSSAVKNGSPRLLDSVGPPHVSLFMTPLCVSNVVVLANHHVVDTFVLKFYRGGHDDVKAPASVTINQDIRMTDELFVGCQDDHLSVGNNRAKVRTTLARDQ